MGSIENTLSWANPILKLILSALFAFKIVHVRGLALDAEHLRQFSPALLLRTFFLVYKESLLKQYIMISVNRKDIPLP